MPKIYFSTISLTWDILGGVNTFFAPFRGFTRYHFEFFFDIFKTINMYTPYLGTGHWLENPFKIMGI